MGLRIDQLTGPTEPDAETVEQYRIASGAKRIVIERGEDGLYTGTAEFEGDE